MLAAILPLFMIGRGHEAFRLTLFAPALVVAHAVFWIVTWPVNRWWLSSQLLAGAGKRFFATGISPAGAGTPEAMHRGLEKLRDRWKCSPLLRVVRSMAAIVAWAVAVAAPR
jgi:hypothetical protein